MKLQIKNSYHTLFSLLWWQHGENLLEIMRSDIGILSHKTTITCSYLYCEAVLLREIYVVHLKIFDSAIEVDHSGLLIE